jgi:multidrug efflux pump subunit AcrB
MIKYFSEHPTAANLLMFGIIVMGLMGIPQLRRETLPDFSSDEVEVTVKYPGAAAEDVEEAICRRIEDAVDLVNNVAEIRSEAQEGLGRVVIEMDEGKDFQTFIDDIRTEVEAIDDFPILAEEPIIRELGRTDKVVSVAVTGPMEPADLKAYCEDLKRRLRRQEGVSLVGIKGFSDHQIRIRIPAQTLMQHGLSLSKIADVIRNQSVDMPAGTIETAESDYLVRITDERRTVHEFEALVVVAGASGAEIRLGDIAEVKDVFEKDEEKAVFNGQQAGILEISKTKSEDSLTVLDGIKRFIDRENQIKPPMVKFALTQDTSSIVRDRLDLLVNNGWQGLLLVFLTTCLFLGFRLSFCVSIALPVSFLGAFFILPHIDYSINMLTMVGLLMALGLLIDSAIVISENFALHLQKNQLSLDASIEGTKEVRAAVISSFATTVVIFGPLSFLGGDIGKILRVVPVTLILVLTVSIVEAFLILPHLLGRSLRMYDPKKRNRFRIWFDEAVERFKSKLVGRLVDAAVKHRYLTASLAICAFIISVGLPASGRLQFQAFPDLEGDVIEARLLMPQGTPLGKTEKLVEKLTNALNEINLKFKPRQPNSQDLIRQVSVQYNSNPDAGESGPHVATVSADLLSADVRNARVDDVLNIWRELVGEVTDVLQLRFTEPVIGPAGKAIEVRLKGDDLQELKAASLEMQNWFGQFKGVYDLSDDLRPGKPEIRIHRRDGATVVGVNAGMLADQLRSAFYGKTAREIQVGTETYEIDVRIAKEDQDSLADLEYFHMTLPDGSQVPIGSVALLEQGRGYVSISGVNGQRTVTVTGEVDTRQANVAQLISKLEKEFFPKLHKSYPAITVSIEGESSEAATTARFILNAFMIGVIGIFILLSYQFRSYSEPLIVMVAIPFALIGVIWGHLLMGLNLTMPSILGFVALAGIVVNNSILLVEFIKIKRREGASIPDAACSASRQRFRAMTITTLTTIAGLLPLLFERSLQAQILIPLVTSVVFGLLSATILVIFVIPALYTILGDMHLVAKVEGKVV